MSTEFEHMKNNMIKGQFRPMGISNEQLLNAFISIPREKFITDEKKNISYFDGDIEIKYNRWLLSSLTIARLINLVKVSQDDIILEIGSCVGYSAAVLAQISSLVFTVEEDKELAKIAEKNLNEIPYDNTIIVNDKHISGYEKSAPYDKIFIFGSVNYLPENLFEQISSNGCLITVLNNSDKKDTFGNAVVFKKNNGIINTTNYYEATLPAMPGFALKEEFKF